MKKASLLKKSPEFSITPKDSIEMHIESKIDIRRKASKLVTAKNSLELLRDSKSRLTILPLECLRKDLMKQKSSISCAKNKCSGKCYQSRSIETDDIFDEDFGHIRKESGERSIKLSHIEVIRVENRSREASVSINEIPIIYDTGNNKYSTDLIGMYKEKPKTKKIRKLLN